MSGAVYLDYNAGAPLRPEVMAAMAEALAQPGNAASVHGFGQAARARVETARAQVAQAVGAAAAAVIFTSGGTEANALALLGSNRLNRFVSAVEHPSVLAQGDVTAIPVDSTGILDLAALETMLAHASEPSLVSVMLANNETGVIQPVAEAAALAHAHGALLHCDAAQGLGRIPVEIRHLNADLLTLSAHKVGGPAGVGALVLSDPSMELAPILRGGGQERRLRAGTHNLAGIVGFGVAAELARKDVQAPDGLKGVTVLRDRLEARAKAMVDAAVVIAEGVPRLPNTSCLSLPGVASATQVMALDLAGVAVSAGSACSSGKVGRSHVLDAMGLAEPVQDGAIRVSLGWASTEEECDAFLAAWSELAARKGFTVRPAARAA